MKRAQTGNAGQVRVVGRRRPPSPLRSAGDTAEHARAWRRALNTPFVPRGVYRFETHEAADRWLWEMLTRHRTHLPPTVKDDSADE